MIKPAVYKLIIFLFVISGLSACGGGGGGSDKDPEPSPTTTVPTPSDPTSLDVTGGGVKGPLANAIVTVFAFDATQAGFKGAVAATGTTNSSAAITGLALPFPISPPYIMEFTSDAGTTDITTGVAPVITTLRTVITQSLLDSGEQIYATPLTTMAVDIAVANVADTNGTAGIQADEFETALTVAASQVVSTLGFGLDSTVDIFDTPPLVDSTTVSATEQTAVAAYRAAVEALTAVAFQINQQNVGGDTDSVLSELAADLADGGGIDGSAGTQINTNTLQVLEQDPATLPIPNSPTNQTVADVQAILVSEAVTTAPTTSVTALDAGGSINTTPEPAETNPDSDGDGTLNVNDAFPDDASETTDSDGDGIGDVADTDDDNNGVLDEDEGVTPVVTPTDTDGDGVLDATDNCPLNVNQNQTNTDGDADGDACDADDDGDGTDDSADAFPLDNAETTDTDSDGTGNVADTDDDNDGVLDVADTGVSPLDGTTACAVLVDCDGDGVFDGADFDPVDATITFNFAPIALDDAITATEDDVTFAISVTANDTDDDGNPGDSVTLTLIGANDISLGAAVINGNNIDYTPVADANGIDTFSYTVSDGTEASTATVTVTITAVNDAPVVDAVGPFNIAENAGNTSAVGTATATDNDSPVTGFSIVSGNSGGAFAIAANGAITVADTNAIDFETAISFILGVAATDGVATSVTQNITVNIDDVNDSVPVITPVGPFSIVEDSVNGAAVGNVLAVDADSVVTSYSISAGNTGAAFAIDNSGAITVANTAAIDFESAISFSLTITATDEINVSAGEVVVVDITDANDSAPVIDAAQSFGLDEDAVNTTVVGSVTASDADTVGSITGFTIADGNTGGAFAIDAAGVITVLDTTAIDFEATVSFTLAVTATDSVNTSVAENVTVDINDINDTAPAVDAAQSFGLDEDAVNTTVVGTVTASDTDTVGSITGFTITGGNTGVAFGIDTAGVITVLDTTAIDFETATSFTLTVTATDSVNTSVAENVTVNINDINDTAPVVDVVGPFGIAENIADLAPVGMVTATDIDTVGTVTGFNITAGNTGSAFAIAANGQITVADTNAIDFETATSFVLTVTATDGINTSVGQAVTININDVNDTAPVVDAVGPFALIENSANSTAVGTVTASDIDTVGSVTGFAITAGNTGTAFAIDAAGAITVANSTALDRETNATFTLTVTATDGINTSADQSVVINLTDVNDTAPVITSSLAFGVNSAATNGTAVGTVVASDADTTGAITGFTITLGNTGSAFAIDASGQITVLDNTSLLANSPYTLTLTATDGVNTSAPETVGITVTTGGAVWDSFNWDDGSTWQ